MSHSDLVAHIQAELDARRWQQGQFASAAGIAASTLSEVLIGKKKPGIRFFIQVSKVINKTPGQLLDIYLK